MIFHYVHGTLVCAIRIKGLTRPIGGFSVHRWWCDDDPEGDDVKFYDGYKYFVCESLPRTAAQRIVDALGGYLVPEFAVPPERQLTAGGPFYVHQFHPRNPYFIAEYPKAEDAIDRANREAAYAVYESSRIRVYGVHNDLVAEFGGA